MPSSARKSSVGSALRRGPQKAHIPYRGDNPEVGKKTGIAVQHVERKSDGFEPFDVLMEQADGRTPPRPKGRKKSLAAVTRQDDYYDDEDGEMSMQLDSPVHHLTNLRPPSTPSSSRNRSSIRPVARTSDIDYDKIPSPRPTNSMQRNARNGGPGPSSLSRSMRVSDPEPPSDSPDEAGDYDNGQDQDFDDYAPQEGHSPPRSSPRRTSFGRIEQDQDDEDEGQEQEEPPHNTPLKSKQDKGKRKAERYEEPEREEEVEDEIAQGLEDVDLGPDPDEEEDDDTTPQPPSKKPKKEVMREQPSTKSRTKKENRSPRREGVRKSQRQHYKPLEYWRGEKLVYGKSEHAGPILVPQVREIIRIPKEEIMPLPLGKRKRGTTRGRSHSRAVETGEYDIPPALPVEDPEEGWDNETQAKCTVLHYTTKEEVERRIAWTAKMVEPRQAANNGWSFDKIFGDDDFIAAGQLIIPPRSRKPPKAAKDNTYVFYVIEGAVNLKIYDTSMIVATGGMFMVPRGNTYFIENVCNRDAKLFFTQARKVEMNRDEMAARAATIAETERRKSLLRSSSAGAPTTTSRAAAVNGRAVSMAAYPSATRRT
ncbi:Mif2/CENP-C like-domain-containing protein [Crassisporium funariophilum]|nr:Mif2/CENP-C like-domain-containing protein [Crassisporium funariophilum]